MKATFLLQLACILILGCAMTLTACSSDPDSPATETDGLPAARITETIRKDEAKATVYNIEYPSLDPYGRRVTVSGSIVVGDEVRQDMHVRGMVLYNHFTVYHKDDCPSRGDLGIVLKVVGSKMIAVASDYYGFDATGDKHQAYCLWRTNAQNSIDALLAARKLLKDLGYRLDDYLFNLGYSEGGQTSMGVLRLCAEKYPDIKITHTVAGAGPYDIGETYRQLVSSGETSMPSTVISTLLAYNEYNELDVDNNEMFLDPILDNILIYLLSKDYKRDDLEGKLASYKIADWINPILFDFNSDLSLKFMEVFEKDNLSKGWKPRGDERISLVHNTLDACVPYANTTQMAEFFKQAGFTVDEGRTEDRYVDGKVFVYSVNVPALSEKTGTHEAGAIAFVAELVIVVCHYLDIKPWFSLTAEELEGV
jgi:hypothetical protein